MFKKITKFIFITSFLTSGFAFGQIIIDKNDMPEKGDTARVSTGLNMSITDPSETGENYTWDFSDLTPVKQRIDTFVNVMSTPQPAGALFLLSADFALRMAGNLPFPGVPVSDPYQYYKSSNSAFKMVGFALKMQGFGIPATFDEPDILYKFPLAYGNVDSSFSGTDMTIPGTGYLQVERKRVNSVDGWGTLITPYGTFDVLRVKSEVEERDSIYIESQETGINVPYSYTEYKWLGKNQKIPLLTIRDILGGIVVEYADSIRGTLDIPENRITISGVSAFPNPVTNKATILFNVKQKSTVSLTIVDISGKQVYKTVPETFVPGEHNISINFNNLKLHGGIYFANLITPGNTLTVKLLYLP